jgi:hypothetical protein
VATVFPLLEHRDTIRGLKHVRHGQILEPMVDLLLARIKRTHLRFLAGAVVPTLFLFWGYVTTSFFLSRLPEKTAWCSPSTEIGYSVRVFNVCRDWGRYAWGFQTGSYSHFVDMFGATYLQFGVGKWAFEIDYGGCPSER